MANDEDLLITLLRLKSYLLSLIDSPSEGNDSLEYSEEYLLRKFPEQKEKIILMLKQNEIYSDAQIVFDNNIQNKFQNLVKNDFDDKNLDEILSRFGINAGRLLQLTEWSTDFKEEREKHLKQLVSILIKLANEWVSRKGIEESFDDYSTLAEEEVIRPEELEQLYSLDYETGLSFSKLSTLTLIYLKLFVDYLFEHGGNISLKNFQEKLLRISNNIDVKYKNLFDQSGLTDK